jgi:hypothetical protein
MKATAPPAKRRRGPRLAVLALVFCSLLVPIAFLFNRFPAGESPPRIPRNAGAAAPPRIGSAPFPADLFRGCCFLNCRLVRDFWQFY